MIIERSRIEGAAEKYPAFVRAVLPLGKDTAKGWSIETKTYYETAKANGVDFVAAKAIVLGESGLKVVGRMAASFVETAGKSVAQVVQGGKLRVTPEQEAQRISICSGCQFYLPADRQCSECGCKRQAFMPNKWAWAAATCPRGLWTAVNEPLKVG